jgi:hypothetical protein
VASTTVARDIVSAGTTHAALTTMKFRLEMAQVRECSVQSCAYNRNEGCHAKAITVGDGVHPGCDTYARLDHHVRDVPTAGVGACKVEVCRHNRGLECAASAIRVEREPGGARCATFERAA